MSANDGLMKSYEIVICKSNRTARQRSIAKTKHQTAGMPLSSLCERIRVQWKKIGEKITVSMGDDQLVLSAPADFKAADVLPNDLWENIASKLAQNGTEKDLRAFAATTSFFNECARRNIDKYNKKVFTRHLFAFLQNVMYGISYGGTFELKYADDDKAVKSIFVTKESKDPIVPNSRTTYTVKHDDREKIFIDDSNTAPVNQFDGIDDNADEDSMIDEKTDKIHMDIAEYIAVVIGSPKKCIITGVRNKFPHTILDSYAKLNDGIADESTMTKKEKEVYTKYNKLNSKYFSQVRKYQRMEGDKDREKQIKARDNIWKIEREMNELLPKVQEIQTKHITKTVRGGKNTQYIYNNRPFKVHIGSRGGQYILVNGNKKYIQS